MGSMCMTCTEKVLICKSCKTKSPGRRSGITSENPTGCFTMIFMADLADMSSVVMFFRLYDAKRRELACKWAQNDGLAWMLIQGAVQSPQVRLRSTHIQSRCVECGHCNPTWDHLWKCFTGEEAPEDVLLQRHLWPRDARDLVLCQAFLDGMRRFNDGQ